VKRIPIRLRLTLVFAGVMAVVLGSVGLFLRVTLAHELDAGIDQGLRARAADVAALVLLRPETLSPVGHSPLTERGERFAQVLDVQGQILDTTPLVRRAPLIDRSQLARALRHPILIDREAGPGAPEPLRILARSTLYDGRPVVVAVGTSLVERREATGKLGTLLVIGGPLTLLLASGAAYWLGRAALRPVETMRRRAARITGGTGERLPLAPARDEVRRLGETLNGLLARVDDALIRERTFVADAGHELRTPLAILRTELDLALRGQHSAPELRAALASARVEAERLNRLADDLLVVAQADQGRLPVHPEPLPAAQLLQTVGARAAASAREAGRPLRVVASTDLVLRGDALRLEQALGNLLDNALRHGDGPIILSARADGDWLELEVRDAGPGFPPEFLARAFQRFSRADHARGRGGAGLGLALVRAIALAHGGDVTASNQPGSGATVRLRLPADVVPAPPEPHPTEPTLAS
jgi:signal transduction histidine kinase